MKTMITVVGARPQFIKAAMVSRAIVRCNAALQDSSLRIQELLIHTGQHFDANMSDIFFQELGISEPDYHLGYAAVDTGR
jgi:UDP-GlcNAc3NAcA epimerase